MAGWMDIAAYLLFEQCCGDADGLRQNSVHSCYDVTELLLGDGAAVRYRLHHLSAVLPLQGTDHSWTHIHSQPQLTPLLELGHSQNVFYQNMLKWGHCDS